MTESNEYQRSEAANQQPVQPPKGTGATQAEPESINGARPDDLSYEMIPSEEVAPELQHPKD